MTEPDTLVQDRLSPAVSSRSWRLHAAITLFVALCGATISWTCSSYLLPYLTSEQQNNVWFGADTPQVYAQLTSRWSERHSSRLTQHPLFALLTTPAIWMMVKATQWTPDFVVRVALAATTAANAAVVYVVLRSLLTSTRIALFWTTIYLASSGFIFWCGAPETFCFGMLSLLLPLMIVAYPHCFMRRDIWLPAAMLTSLAVTVTNIMSGIAVAIVLKGIRSTHEYLKTCVLWGLVALIVQAHIIPPTRSLSLSIFGVFSSEGRYMRYRENESWHHRPTHVILAGVLIPKISGLDQPSSWPPDTQNGLDVHMRSYNLLGFVGVVVWLALLALAVVHGWQQGKNATPLYKALAIVIAGQLALHWLYGQETFLYSAHYGPPLILFSAYACQTRFRSLAIVLAAMLVAIEVANNVPAFLWSAEYVRTLAANAPSP